MPVILRYRTPRGKQRAGVAGNRPGTNPRGALGNERPGTSPPLVTVLSYHSYELPGGPDPHRGRRSRPDRRGAVHGHRCGFRAKKPLRVKRAISPQPREGRDHAREAENPDRPRLPSPISRTRAHEAYSPAEDRCQPIPRLSQPMTPSPPAAPGTLAPRMPSLCSEPCSRRFSATRRSRLQSAFTTSWWRLRRENLIVPRSRLRCARGPAVVITDKRSRPAGRGTHLTARQRAK
jgi:hypothetical protein